MIFDKIGDDSVSSCHCSNVSENMSFKMPTVFGNDKPKLLKVCCHSAAEAVPVPATPALHVGSHRGRLHGFCTVWFDLFGSKHGLKHPVCAKWQILFCAFLQWTSTSESANALRKVATCRIQTGRISNALGCSRCSRQCSRAMSSHDSPIVSTGCNAICNVMCHATATLMAMWWFKFVIAMYCNWAIVSSLFRSFQRRISKAPLMI